MAPQIKFFLVAPLAVAISFFTGAVLVRIPGFDRVLVRRLIPVKPIFAVIYCREKKKT